MKKIVLVRGFYPDPRCGKRLDALCGRYDLTLLYWQKVPEDLREFSHKGVKAEKIFIPANLTNPMKRLLPYRKFWKECFQKLVEEHPDMIWAEAIDMLDIACAYKDRVDPSVKIIYEVADLHRYLIDGPKNALMKGVQHHLRSMDVKDCAKIDLLILTSEKYYEIYFSSFVSQEKLLIVPNMPDIEPLKKYVPKNHEGKKTIGFVGGIRYIEQARLLVEAANLAGWNTLFAGSENGTEIKDLTANMDNVTYLGRFDYESQIADIYGLCDVVHSVYNADMRNVRLALPNKLYESIYCELPIIVAKGTYLQEVVEQMGVGVGVSHNDANDLAEVLRKMDTDKSYYEMLVNHCKSHKNDIGIEKYNEQIRMWVEKLLN